MPRTWREEDDGCRDDAWPVDGLCDSVRSRDVQGRESSTAGTELRLYRARGHRVTLSDPDVAGEASWRRPLGVYGPLAGESLARTDAVSVAASTTASAEEGMKLEDGDVT